MSRFYSEINGGRGTATRQGHKFIYGHIRGWNVGVKVAGEPDPKTGEDVFYVFLTSGSNGIKSQKLIGAFRESDLEKGGQ